MARRLSGILLVAVGVAMLALAARDALAGTPPTVFGDGSTDALRGSGEAERLAGLGEDDVIRGFAGDDELYGGPGRDALLGGAGDDFVEARDGEQDRVVCGPGEDAAGLDAQDRVAPGCETLDFG